MVPLTNEVEQNASVLFSSFLVEGGSSAGMSESYIVPKLSNCPLNALAASQLQPMTNARNFQQCAALSDPTPHFQSLCIGGVWFA